MNPPADPALLLISALIPLVFMIFILALLFRFYKFLGLANTYLKKQLDK